MYIYSLASQLDVIVNCDLDIKCDYELHITIVEYDYEFLAKIRNDYQNESEQIFYEYCTNLIAIAILCIHNFYAHLYNILLLLKLNLSFWNGNLLKSVLEIEFWKQHQL